MNWKNSQKFTRTLSTIPEITKRFQFSIINELNSERWRQRDLLWYTPYTLLKHETWLFAPFPFLPLFASVSIFYIFLLSLSLSRYYIHIIIKIYFSNHKKRGKIFFHRNAYDECDNPSSHSSRLALTTAKHSPFHSECVHLISIIVIKKYLTHWECNIWKKLYQLPPLDDDC